MTSEVSHNNLNSTLLNLDLDSVDHVSAEKEEENSFDQDLDNFGWGICGRHKKGFEFGHKTLNKKLCTYCAIYDDYEDRTQIKELRPVMEHIQKYKRRLQMELDKEMDMRELKSIGANLQDQITKGLRNNQDAMEEICRQLSIEINEMVTAMNIKVQENFKYSKRRAELQSKLTWTMDLPNRDDPFIINKDGFFFQIEEQKEDYIPRETIKQLNHAVEGILSQQKDLMDHWYKRALNEISTIIKPQICVEKEEDVSEKKFEPRIDRYLAGLRFLREGDKVTLELEEFYTEKKHLEEMLSEMKQLTSLEIKISEKQTTMTQDQIQELFTLAVSSADNLKEIYFKVASNNEVTDELVTCFSDVLLAQAKRLEDITLELNGTKVGDVGVCAFAKGVSRFAGDLTKIKLGLNSTFKLTEKGITSLFISTPNVKDYTLRLDKSVVSDKDIDLFNQNCLASMVALKELNICLSGTTVSDQSVSKLFTNMQQVKKFEMQLEDTKITDETVKAFLKARETGLKNLKEFLFSSENTKVTEEYLNLLDSLQKQLSDYSGESY